MFDKVLNALLHRGFECTLLLCCYNTEALQQCYSNFIWTFCGNHEENLHSLIMTEYNFFWLLYSRIKTEMKILYLSEKIRVGENPYCGIFYAVLHQFSIQRLWKPEWWQKFTCDIFGIMCGIKFPCWWKFRTPSTMQL